MAIPGPSGIFNRPRLHQSEIGLRRGWAVVIPTLAWVGGPGAALLIGGVAGLLPELRAARMSPTEALWTV